MYRRGCRGSTSGASRYVSEGVEGACADGDSQLRHSAAAGAGDGEFLRPSMYARTAELDLPIVVALLASYGMVSEVAVHFLTRFTKKGLVFIQFVFLLVIQFILEYKMCGGNK